MKVLQFPLAKITIVFIAGIFVSNYISLSLLVVFSILLVVTCAFGISYFYSNRNSGEAIFFGVLTYFLAFSIGISTQVFHADSYQSSNYIHSNINFEKPHIVTAVVREKLSNSSSSQRFVVQVKQIDSSLKTGKILLNIRKNGLKDSFEIGTNLQIKGNLIVNSSNKNPNQFDYSNYLKNKQIYAQIYADPSEIKKGAFLEKNIWYYASKIRTKIIRNLEKSRFNPTELHVVEALILGQKQDLDPEILKNYQYAGAVHILSVSGLHVGFILVIINFLLKPFPNTARVSLIKLIVVLLSLFSFGVLAGLSPSVVRSVTMFSFVALGMYLRRSTNIFHTLLVSMLLILLFQPSFLFDVGFQLSYLALFFILWLQPLLANIWTPNNKVGRYFWDILTVSFAAQIGTFPLSIYYFHQFPGLFFVTNLVVIPFLGVIMVFGILVMGLALFNCIPLFLVQFLEACIWVLNKIIASIAALESFVFRDISLNIQLLISLYLLMIATIFWFNRPSFNRLVVALISVIVFQITCFETSYSIQNQNEWIVFNSKKSSLIAKRSGRNVILYANDSILKAASKNQVVSTYLLGNFSQLKDKKSLRNLMYFKNNKILIIDSVGLYPKNSRPDVVVLTNSPKINLERFLQIAQPKIVVADASNYKTLQKKWKATCLKEKIPFHATYEKGFYKLD